MVHSPDHSKLNGHPKCPAMEGSLILHGPSMHVVIKYHVVIKINEIGTHVLTCKNILRYTVQVKKKLRSYLSCHFTEEKK